MHEDHWERPLLGMGFTERLVDPWIMRVVLSIGALILRHMRTSGSYM